ncbi:MAG TPA: acetyl xylan esterase [Planctomycetota bacterium]|nr:acetyl xylan esterase [Planctomycetota bacterium]
MTRTQGRLLAAILAILAVSTVPGEQPQAAEKEQSMAEQRPSHVRHLNERMTMPKYETKGAWEKRAAWLRDHIRVSCGLVPEPEKTPLNAQVFGKIEREGYSIEKAYIESRPGFYACGNLFRPLGKKGPFPAVACPHGHWAQGRFGHEGEPKGSVPARCITLARMGCVVFAYDMVGYNDSKAQIGHSIAGTRNELWGISLMALQTWNAVRVLDWLQTLPDVDPEKLAVTGCSGGGTQTFMIMGIDPRVKVAAPVNMISCTMQGGCECENAPLLRIETNNMEIGALMAPRPLILCNVSGDWTKETPKVEYPAIRSVFDLCGVPDRVTNVPLQGPHGYPKGHREAVYNFFRKWLMGIQDATPFTEPPFQVEKKEELLVWQGRELPKDAKKRDTLEAYMIAECRRQRDELLPRKPEDRKRFDETLGLAYRHAILAELPKAEDLDAQKLADNIPDDARVTPFTLGRKGKGDRMHIVLYRPPKPKAGAPAIVLVHPDGGNALLNPTGGEPVGMLAALLDAGHLVLTIDAYLTGESAKLRAVRDGAMKGKKFFSAYNRTDLVERVQDILTSLAWLKTLGDVKEVGLVGVGQAGAWCLFAAPFTPEGTRVVADLAQVGNDEHTRWQTDLFTPCLLKAGGFATAVALAAPRPLLLHDVAADLDVAPFRAAYAAANAPKSLRIERNAAVSHGGIAAWLE